jgi:hypothetical protein
VPPVESQRLRRASSLDGVRTGALAVALGAAISVAGGIPVLPSMVVSVAVGAAAWGAMAVYLRDAGTRVPSMSWLSGTLMAWATLTAFMALDSAPREAAPVLLFSVIVGLAVASVRVGLAYLSSFWGKDR